MANSGLKIGAKSLETKGCERGDSNPHGFPHRDLNPENAILSGQAEKALVALTCTFIDYPSGQWVLALLCVVVLGCKMVVAGRRDDIRVIQT